MSNIQLIRPIMSLLMCPRTETVSICAFITGISNTTPAAVMMRRIHLCYFLRYGIAGGEFSRLPAETCRPVTQKIYGVAGGRKHQAARRSRNMANAKGFPIFTLPHNCTFSKKLFDHDFAG